MFHQKGPDHGGKSNMVCWIIPFAMEVLMGTSSTQLWPEIPIINGYNWLSLVDYTFQKWGFVSTYNW